MRRSVLATILVLLASLLLTAPPASAFPRQCYEIDRTWRIQEGTVDINLARVDVVGQVCTGEDGLFDPLASQVIASVRTTKAGNVTGYTYTLRGQQLVKSTSTRLRWRVYVTYNICAVKYLPVCGPGDPQFHFDIRAKILFMSYMGTRRTPIVADNLYAEGARWS